MSLFYLWAEFGSQMMWVATKGGCSQSKNDGFIKKMLKHISFYFILFFFNAKTNFFQKNKFFSSVLILLPTQGILNYSAFCMLIFCMNQCRCSLNAKRSCCISVIICVMKIRYLKPNLREKKLLFCMFSS